jgi:hypothetical protein
MISIADTHNALTNGGFKAFNWNINSPRAKITIEYIDSGSISSLARWYMHKHVITLDHGCMASEKKYKYHDSWGEDPNDTPKLEYEIKYGKYVQDKRYKTQKYRHAHYNGSDGLIRLNTRLLNLWPGICESLWVHGRLLKQSFFHRNGKLAYELRPCDKTFEVRTPRGALHMKLSPHSKVVVSRKQGIWRGYGYGEPILNHVDAIKSYYIEKYEKGEIVEIGCYVDGKRKYDWVVNGEKVYYERGTAIPKEYIDMMRNGKQMTIPELMKIENTQVRAIMFEKSEVTQEQLKSACELIDEAVQVMNSSGKEVRNPMKLYKYPSMDGHLNKFLEVICPTTGTKYQLDVPKDSEKCMDALQWTYGVDQMLNDKPIQFVEET